MSAHDDHLVDTKIKLGQCNRCEAFVFLAMSSGIRSAADVTPADRDAYIATLMDGRRSFDLGEVAGRPSKLLSRRLGSPAPPYDPGGSQISAQGRRKVLVEHGCGGRARNMVTFREVEQGPPPARAMPGSSRAGGPLPEAAHGLRVESIPRSPASPASRHRSEVLGRCGICGRKIQKGEPYWSITRGNEWIDGTHEECP